MARPQLTILGAGPPRFPGHQPSVQRIDRRRKVLDWILQAFQDLDPKACFVGGYEIKHVIQAFPQLSYRINNDWRNSGAVASLALAPMASGRDHYICYSDILFRDELVARLASGSKEKLSVAVDPTSLKTMDSEAPAREAVIIAKTGLIGGQMVPPWPDAGSQDKEAAEFIGLVRIPAARAEAFAEFVANQKTRLAQKNISALIGAWVEVNGPQSAYACESQGLWTSLEDNTRLSRFILGSKARTLANLHGRLTKSEIAPIVHFSRAQWDRSDGDQVKRTLETFREGDLIVRSSAVAEDGFAAANAGRFLSLLDVSPTPEALRSAVTEVLRSYGEKNPDDQILIQPMLQDVTCSGVIFTRVLSSGAPYYVINYTMGTSTTGITSGTAQNHETAYVYRRAPAAVLAAQPPLIRRLVEMVREIEALIDYDALDIEFAVVEDGRTFTLQVRPLTTDAVRYDRGDDEEIDALLDGVRNQLAALNAPGPEVAGGMTAWSCMTDWNPAEIIGVKPQPLAYSLYRTLITDDVWAKQRAQCGYRDVRPLPLVRSFAGHAYVDVRGSLNSFIPASLDDKTACKLVEFGLATLRASPHLHDKVEFAIIPTCVDFAFDNWRNRLASDADLTAEEVDALTIGLAKVTNAIVDITDESLVRIRTLESDTESILSARDAPLERLRRLLYRCRRDGTLAFAHVARGGFVAASWLKSAVQSGALGQQRVEAFQSSVSTVSSNLAGDAWKVKNGQLAWPDFVARYGHLRPGTYDVTSPTYGEIPEDYLRPLVDQAQVPEYKVFDWEDEELARIGDCLKEYGLAIMAGPATAFMRDAIVGREYAKFVFTRLVSAALELIAQVLEDYDLRREDAPLLEIADLLYLATAGGGPAIDREFLRARLAESTKRSALHGKTVLPPVLFAPDAVYCFEIPHSEPNFISLGKVKGKVVTLEGRSRRPQEINGRIVAVRQADPGYDWVFGLGAAGLVTAFGGANSHMAIRAAEYGLPAVIGIGDKLFDQLSDGVMLEIDCAARRFTLLG